MEDVGSVRSAPDERIALDDDTGDGLSGIPDIAVLPTSPGGRGYHRVAVTALAFAAAVLYGAVSFQQYLTFRTSTYDLVIFDEGIRSYSHFHLPVAIVKGVHNSLGIHVTILGDHFSPVLALLAPLYWIYDGPQTLLVAQALLFAAAVVPLWAFTRRELSTGAAYLVAAGYALSWPVAQAVSFDFHEAAFVPLATALLFDRLSAYRRGNGRWWQVALAALFLLTIKEDTGLLLAGLGLTLLVLWCGSALRRRSAGRQAPGRQAAGQLRLFGVAFVVGGLAVTYVTSRILVLAFGGGAKYDWRYGNFGATVPAAARHVVTHPSDVLRTFVTPEVKVHTMLLLLAIAALAPLVSPYLLVVLPPLAERMLGEVPNWWGTDFHYNAFIVVALLCAGVDGAARVQRWVSHAHPGDDPSTAEDTGAAVGGLRFVGGRFLDLLRAVLGPRVGLIWALAVLVVAVVSVPSFGFARLTESASWQRTPAIRAAAAAVAQVPSGVLVEVPNNLGPQLSGRSTVLLWDKVPRWAPWVIADVARQQFPFCDVAQQAAEVDFLRKDGYQLVFQRDGYLVLHHPGPLPAISDAPTGGCP